MLAENLLLKSAGWEKTKLESERGGQGLWLFALYRTFVTGSRRLDVSGE